MYSLNVPVPPAVKRLAADLAPELTPFRTVRDRHTLVVKRFDADEAGDSLAHLRERLRPVLAGVPPFEVRVTGIDAFENPPMGAGPVVYLVVEGEGLRRVHELLVREFGAVEGLEGDEYTPHVTLARGVGGDRDEVNARGGNGDTAEVGARGGHGDAADVEAAVERLRERDLEPVEWTVDELGIWTREYREFAARFRL